MNVMIPLPRTVRALGTLAFALLLTPGAAAAQVDLVELTVADIQEGLRAGRFTAEELTRASLARIGRYEGRDNAFISMNPDALAQARALDVEFAGSGPRGPLHGVPVVTKDNIDYGGLVTTAGFDGFSSAMGGVDLIPERDATVVRRLRAAGGVIIG